MILENKRSEKSVFQLILDFGQSTMGLSTNTIFQHILILMSRYNKAGHGFGIHIQNHGPACTETDPSYLESQPPYNLAIAIFRRNEVR